MSFQDDASASSSEGVAYPWILEHLLAYPGSYEIPLRTMYTLNATTQAQQQQQQQHNPSGSPPPSPTALPGNAFPAPRKVEQHNLTTATAAAQLRANLMSHISQLPSQPCSLPPSFVTSFVRRCFPPELDQVDFPQALTALDYLKDLEVRRRREVVAALDRLGVDKADLGQRAVLGRKYPGVLRWVISIEDKERKVEALYTQVYLGLRRWTLINELSLTPFNKANCIAMLNTVYPPTMMPNTQFIQPTHQLTPAILSSQRNGFFRYITAVEKHGTNVLKSLIAQGQRPGEETGWPSVRETMDKYLRMANGIIDECFTITGTDSVHSPVSSSFGEAEVGDPKRRKVDSGISFGTSSSNRGSTHSHQTRPSTGSSATTHSRSHSTEKPLPPQPQEAIQKPAGSTLERIAREIRKIRSRGDIRDAAKARPAPAVASDVTMTDADAPAPPTPGKDRKLRLRPSLMKMRSNGALREKDANSAGSRPTSRDGDGVEGDGTPAFDVAEMKRTRMVWEARQGKKGSKDGTNTNDIDGTTLPRGV